MSFTLNDIDHQMTFTFEQALVEYKYEVELWNFILLTLTLNPMTLLLKLDLNIVKIYVCTKMKYLASVVQKLQPEQTHRWTHRQTQL